MTIPEKHLKTLNNLAPEEMLVLISQIALHRACRNKAFESSFLNEYFDEWIDSLLNSDLVLLLGELICLVPDEFE